MSTEKNYFSIKNQIPAGVELVAVSKTHPAEKIKEVYDLGQRSFGENKVQELVEKVSLLPGDIRWHLIGHLQSNKVKYIAPFIDTIQSVDSEKLLAEIDRQAAKYQRKLKVLLQVYIASEESKFGLDFAETEIIYKKYLAGDFPNVLVSGLMGMASFTKDEQQIKREFSSLKHFFDRLSAISPFQTLSMGMSGDFPIAIECGATSVRVGSAIFGERPYTAHGFLGTVFDNRKPVAQIIPLKLIKMQKILIVEDEKAISGVLENILSDELTDYDFIVAEDGFQGLKQIEKEDFALVISDIKMPKVSGTELLKQALEIKPDTTFLMISGHADIETAVSCLKDGAYDFISKPVDINRLITSVKNALDKAHLQKTNQNLQAENKTLKRKVNKKYQMIGDSPALKKIQDMIEKVAPSDARVLITGPNGAGKELVAHAIHAQSDRSKGPMVEVNCAAIPSELIESELFGHVKGSFTGAIKDKQGKFELANNGTIFLDEIGDMSLIAQAKVLRALQESKVSPVGSDREIRVDVRVIAATNKDMQKEIAAGRFREDLYHRLSVIEIYVPPLDDRKEDIKLLVNHFSQIIADEHGTSAKIFEDDAISALQNFSWTGNIRELRNVVERLIILGGPTVTAEDVVAFVRK